MKELYISPEVELIGFVAEEKMANIGLDFGDMDSGSDYENGFDSGSEQSQAGDIHLPFPKLG